MVAYYNEFDPFAAAWLRALIDADAIPFGVVDTRSITDVRPSDLQGYTQCHFFAGIGGWPLSLRLAGWPDDRPVWTGSCPCQPFSSAGTRSGDNDPRALWWAFRWLIQNGDPATVYGEQVASKAGREWFAGVRADLEALGYACGGADLCAAGVGAPHIRQRLFWVAHSFSSGSQGRLSRRKGAQWQVEYGYAGRHRAASGLPDADSDGQQARNSVRPAGSEHDAEYGGGVDPWSGTIYIDCADGKARRIEPGIKPLADGIPRGVVPGCDPGAPGYAENTAEARKMRLSGYGNAIVPQEAAEFIQATQAAIREIEGVLPISPGSRK